jgi:hypothetical protein
VACIVAQIIGAIATWCSDIFIPQQHQDRPSSTCRRISRSIRLFEPLRDDTRYGSVMNP